MKFLSSLAITFISFTAYCQTIEVISKSGFKSITEAKTFAYIEPATDTNFLQFVATIQAKGENKKEVILSFYSLIKNEANKLGATCYKLKSFKGSKSDKEAVLVLDCYFAWDATLKINADNHEKNVVYIFGGQREGDKTISFHVNHESKKIESGTYYKFILREGDRLKLSKGGATGQALLINWEKEKEPQFYSLSGFATEDMTRKPVSNPHHQNVAGVEFNTGRIHPIENIDFGLLLVNILKRAN